MGPWRWVGDAALLRTFDEPLEQANAAARALASRVAAHREVQDSVPGAVSVLVTLRPGAAPGAALLRDLEAPPSADPEPSPGAHEITVVYDGEDLDQVARIAGLSSDDVVALHCGAVYTVAFVGFSPGFGYLLGLPEALRVARLETPRTRVPAGSVAIAGGWAAVYPSATPGGWRLIGRTDAVLFDATRERPATLRAGDRVHFVPR